MDVADRIRKLLALSRSPVESEAQLALTKARELMAKYKIHEADIEDKDTEIVWHWTEFSYTTLTDGWLGHVASVIATSFGCGMVVHLPPRKKRRSVVLVGTKAEVNAVSEAISYALGYIKQEEKRYARYLKNNLIIGSPKEALRDHINSYGLGFACGLQKAFDKQNNIAEETGLALTVSPKVQEMLDKVKYKKVKTVSAYDQQAFESGVKDGKEFNCGAKKIG